jgi:hypothetical protein
MARAALLFIKKAESVAPCVLKYGSSCITVYIIKKTGSIALCAFKIWPELHISSYFKGEKCKLE